MLNISLGICQAPHATYSSWYNSYVHTAHGAVGLRPTIAAFAYDALDLFVRALDAAASSNTTLDGSLAAGLAVKNALLNVNAFQGKTGTVQLDSTTGDRDIKLYVQNLQASFSPQHPSCHSTLCM